MPVIKAKEVKLVVDGTPVALPRTDDGYIAASRNDKADELQLVLSENGYMGMLSRPPNPHVLGRIDLDAGPVVTLYRTGKALLQGRNAAEHGDNIKALLRFCEWEVK